MKIVYLITSLGNSAGMERVLCTKANYLSEKCGYQVHIITQNPTPADSFFEFSPSIIIESLNLSHTIQNKLFRFIGSFVSNLEYKKKLSVRLKQIKPDITISMCGNEFNFLYKLKDGSIKIAEFHFSRNYLNHLIQNIPELNYRCLRLLMVKWIQFRQRTHAKYYQKVVLLTSEDKKLWGNKPYLCNIPNPVSFTLSGTAKLENKQIIAIGRFTAQKGFDLLIESFMLIASRVPDWNLLIIGEGQDEIYLKKLIDQKNITNKVTISPPIKNIQGLLLKSSILAFPSRYEGFGLVITEGMEAGVPCIAYKCECGPSEIIKHGEDGFLVETFNTTQFAEYLEVLMKDNKLRTQMGIMAKQNAKRFHTEYVMSQWINIFTELVENKQKSNHNSENN